MKTILHDAHTGLLRALRTLLTPATVMNGLPTLTIEGLATRTWASATFTGHTHIVELQVRGTNVERVLEQLSSLDPMIPGHALIDLSVTDIVRTAEGARVAIEVLTLED